MLRRRLTSGRYRREDGFLLIESLVAIVAGVAVMLALFAILEFSEKQSTRLADAAESTQLGRIAMNHIVGELHSACLSEGFTPVQEQSSENELILVNGYSEEPVIPTTGTAQTGVREDKIVWNATTHSLIDYTYYATGENSSGEYTFASTATPATGVQLGLHITRMKETVEHKEVEAPIFKYYAYATSAGTSTSAASDELSETTLVKAGETLSATGAETVAAVVVSFNAAPHDGSEVQGRLAPLSTQNTLAFSAPDNETAVKDEPCN